jgi:hypothetical protein
VTAFLIDEMFPVAAAGLLRTRHGRDAVHVTEVGLRAAADTQVAAAARAQGRAVVAENVADFAAEREPGLGVRPEEEPASGRRAGCRVGQDLGPLGQGPSRSLSRSPLAGDGLTVHRGKAATAERDIQFALGALAERSSARSVRLARMILIQAIQNAMVNDLVVRNVANWLPCPES